MNPVQLAKRDRLLAKLWAQSQHWQRIENDIKLALPANLRPYIRVAHMEDGCLVILAHNNMAASRIRMLAAGLLPRFQALLPEIQYIRIKLVPQSSAPEKHNPHTLSETALNELSHTADNLAHHPELAAALTRLVQKHRK